MSDGEVELIMRMLAENVQTYDQVTEVRFMRCYLEYRSERRSVTISATSPPPRPGTLELWALSSAGSRTRFDSRHLQ